MNLNELLESSSGRLTWPRLGEKRKKPIFHDWPITMECQDELEFSVTDFRRIFEDETKIQINDGTSGQSE